MYPIRFEPIYQTYVWGGDRISRMPNRQASAQKVAESWEISDREEGMSICKNGSYKGKTLHAILREMKESLLGQGQQFSRFPILTKIIDAKENLSIQVHPDEFTAPKLGGEPKSEMWFALDDSTVYAGLKKGVDEKQFKEAIRKNRLEELLEKFELKQGEAIFIPAGRVHAICKGSLLYEVQQNSNTTYRLYDWGRGRELHLEKGMQAVRFDDQSPEKLTFKNLSSDLHHQMVSILSSHLFNIERIDVFNKHHLAPTLKSFQIYFCIEGEGRISVDSYEEPLYFGASFLVPAACKSIDIHGKCQLLRVRLS